MTDYVTSDLHFWHKNIIKFSPKTRGHFRDINHMNTELENEWNRKVRPVDTIYHLGDFSFGTPEDTAALIRRLNGNIVFINGNHDKNLREALTLLGIGTVGILGHRSIKILDYLEINFNKIKIVLFHFPMIVWNKGHHGALHFHGHCHGSLNRLNIGKRRIDAGFDSLGQIMTVQEVVNMIKDNQYEAMDHHDPVSAR